MIPRLARSARDQRGGGKLVKGRPRGGRVAVPAGGGVEAQTGLATYPGKPVANGSTRWTTISFASTSRVKRTRQSPTRTRSSGLPVKRRTSSAGSLAATRSIALSTRSRIGGSRARRFRRARGVKVTPQFSSLTPRGARGLMGVRRHYLAAGDTNPSTGPCKGPSTRLLPSASVTHDFADLWSEPQPAISAPN